MSMLLELVTVSDETIRRLLDDPPLVWRVIAPDHPEPYSEARGATPSRGFLGRLLRRSPAMQSDWPELKLSAPEGARANLEKAWHGIHFMLTGTAGEGDPPLNLVLGGTPVGDIDVGYGPARVLTAAETAATDQALSLLSDAELRARLDPARIVEEEIYPSLGGEFAEGWEEYLMEYLQVLREFLRQATDARLGILIYLG
jgi:hypothetical protein